MSATKCDSAATILVQDNTSCFSLCFVPRFTLEANQVLSVILHPIGHRNSSCRVAYIAKMAKSCTPLQGLDPTKQKEVDEKMFSIDGTDNKGKLGANAILAVSLAVAKVSIEPPACGPKSREIHHL